MTLEPQGGTTTTIPAWAYWSLMALSAACPVLVASDLLPAIVRLFLAAFNAAIAIVVGVSQPMRSAKAEATATVARERGELAGAGRYGFTSRKPPTDRIGQGGFVRVLVWICLAIAILASAAILYAVNSGCALRIPLPDPQSIGAEETAPDTDTCLALNHCHVALTVTAAVSAGLATAGGAVTAVVGDRDEDLVMGFGIGGAVFAAIAAGAATGASECARLFALQCREAGP